MTEHELDQVLATIKQVIAVPVGKHHWATVAITHDDQLIELKKKGNLKAYVNVHTEPVNGNVKSDGLAAHCTFNDKVTHATHWVTAFNVHHMERRATS